MFCSKGTKNMEITTMCKTLLFHDLLILCENARTFETAPADGKQVPVRLRFRCFLMTVYYDAEKQATKKRWKEGRRAGYSGDYRWRRRFFRGNSASLSWPIMLE